MTTLTKTARREVLTKVLKEAFEPKFADLQKRLVQYALDWRRTNHQVFEGLLARKDARKYLHTKHFYRVYLNGVTAYYPDYGMLSFDAPYKGSPIKINEVTAPYILTDDFIVENVELCTTYESLWDSYRAAHSELLKVLASYRTREALLKDFPEYATYLPTPVVKQLPAVIPAESRAKLSALGIPAKEVV